MTPKTRHQNRIIPWLLALTLACVIASPTVWAAVDDITGEWQITQDFQGRPILSTLTITRKADGTLEGTWGSSTVSNVKFQDGKLTLVRTIQFGGQEITIKYAGTLKDGKLTGTTSSDQGDMAANGTRKNPKSPVLGQWDIKFNVMDREIAPRLVISEKPNGTLACEWTKEDGQHIVSNIKFQEGKLTLTRRSKIQDMDEFQTTFEGTVTGNDLTGVLKGEMGDFPVRGQRVGSSLIGKWNLSITSDQGTFKSQLNVDTDLSGTYELFGEIPIKDLKLDGDQVTFKVEIGPPDQTSKMEFKGKLDGKTLKAQTTSQWGTGEVTGKKVEAAAEIAAPAPAPAAKTAPTGPAPPH